ncbi:hypothetical protein BU23DRAFT_554127, partial [Bimuria novae-zelandiae CBS 107.79]
KTRVPKTARRELPPETKAYAVGAMSAGVSQYSLAKQLPVTQATLSKLLARTRERSEASKLPLWDPYLYETEVGRGGQDIDFSPEQKAAIIAVATQNKEAPGYGRKAPGRKPMLDNAQKKRCLEWAPAHNPDLYKYGDELGFNFQSVIFTNETPARVGEMCGKLRAWAKDDKI